MSTEPEEVVDAVAVKMSVSPERAIAVSPDPPTGLVAGGGGSAFALAMMTAPQFQAMVENMKLARERVRVAVKELMTSGVHYRLYRKAGKGDNGEQPRPSITQDGCGLVRQLYGLVAVPADPVVVYGDDKTAPAVTVHARVAIHRGSSDGPVVAVGIGSCTSWEKKYRYRDASRVCPECQNATGALTKGRYPAKGGPFKGQLTWFCWDRRGGCGMEFDLFDPRITEQTLGQVNNPDPLEQLNTYVKMAVKRAANHGTITAANIEDLFTHDIEDRPEEYGMEEVQGTLDNMGYSDNPYGPPADPAPARQERPTPPSAARAAAPAAQAARQPSRPAAPPSKTPASSEREARKQSERGRFYSLLAKYNLDGNSSEWVVENLSGWLGRQVNLIQMTETDWTMGCTHLIANYGPDEDQPQSRGAGR